MGQSKISEPLHDQKFPVLEGHRLHPRAKIRITELSLANQGRPQFPIRFVSIEQLECRNRQAPTEQVWPASGLDESARNHQVLIPWRDLDARAILSQTPLQEGLPTGGAPIGLQAPDLHEIGG